MCVDQSSIINFRIFHQRWILHLWHNTFPKNRRFHSNFGFRFSKDLVKEKRQSACFHELLLCNPSEDVLTKLLPIYDDKCYFHTRQHINQVPLCYVKIHQISISTNTDFIKQREFWQWQWHWSTLNTDSSSMTLHLFWFPSTSWLYV